MSHIITSGLLLALVAPGILAQNPVQCGNGQLCPSDVPCCSRKALFIQLMPRKIADLSIQNTANVALVHTASVAATL
jgi:hypothetical protein